MKNTENNRARRSLISFGVTALLAVGAATAQVAGGATGIDNSGSYQSEVQACMSGRTQQDRDTCLKEARNAQADKKRGVLDNSNGRFEANAVQRCSVFTGEDRAACEARIMGYGETDGSVAGGGVIREVETVVMPKDASTLTIQPQTDNPVVLVPSSK
jgi:hypothetical protein